MWVHTCFYLRPIANSRSLVTASKIQKSFCTWTKVISYASTREFSYAIQCLEKVLKVFIDIVNTEKNDDTDNESARSLYCW